MTRPTLPATIPGLLIERETPLSFIREVVTGEHAGRRGEVVFRPGATVTYLGEHDEREGVVLVLGTNGWAAVPIDALGVPLDRRTGPAHAAWWLDTIDRGVWKALAACDSIGVTRALFARAYERAIRGQALTDAEINDFRRVVLAVAGPEDAPASSVPA